MKSETANRVLLTVTAIAMTAGCKPGPGGTGESDTGSTSDTGSASDSGSASMSTTGAETTDSTTSSTTDATTTDTETSDSTTDGGDVPPWDGDDPSCGDGIPVPGVWCFTTHDAPGPGVIAAADFDVDGHLDLYTGDAIWFGDGTGAFPDSAAFSWPADSPDGAGYPAVAELDGMPGPDMLVLGPETAVVFRNNGSGTDFSDVLVSNVEGVDFLSVVRVAPLDFDGDGVADLLGTNSLVDTESVLVPILNDGMGGFTPTSPSLSVQEFGACLIVATASLPAVAAGEEGVAMVAGPCNANPLDQFPLLIVRSTGDGSVTYADGPAMGANPHTIAAGRMNNDGLHDLAIWAWGDDTVTIYPGTPVGDFAPGKVHSTADLCPGCPCPKCGSSAMIASDLDGDGSADLVLSAEVARVVLQISTQPVGYWLELKSVFAADFNEDGIGDLVVRNGPAFQTFQILLSNP